MSWTWSAWRAVTQRRRNAHGTRADLETRNLARFRDLVAFVKRRSPYYAAIIEERGIDPATARPEDFPVLTKTDLMERFDEISTDPAVRRAPIEDFLAGSRDPRRLYRNKYLVVHTSGTSGTLCFCVYKRLEWLWGSSQFERIVRPSFRKKTAYVGATQGHFAGVTLALAPVPLPMRMFYIPRAFDINRPTDEIVRALNEFRPRVLTGYARAMRMLADLRVKGDVEFTPRVVVCGGEPLSPQDRRFISDAWGQVHVRNAYATSEHLYMGFDLPFDPGMYLAEDDLIFELRDDCTLVTNLFNRTVPLIRHQMDDVLVPAPAGNARNGPYRIVKEIVGRSEDAPVFLNEAGEEDWIHPIVLVEFYVKGLKAFQVRIVDKTSFRFLAILEPGADWRTFERDATARLRALLADKRMSNVTFQLEPVDRLETDPKSGKFRLIVT